MTCPSWRKRLLRGQNFVRTTWNSAGLSPRVTRHGQCYQSLCQIVWINCSHKLFLLQHRNESNIRFPCTSSKTVPATRVLCEHTKGLVHASRVRIMPLINVSHLLATRPQPNTRMFGYLGFACSYGYRIPGSQFSNFYHRYLLQLVDVREKESLLKLLKLSDF